MRTSSMRRLSAVLLATLLALFTFAAPTVAGAGGDDRPTVSGSTDDDSAADTDPKDADADNAHPSGKDRHEDKGTQGKSTSTPDQNGKGPERDFEGTDKPFVGGDGAGGVDKEDQDGNNGCGNDDDFEDDNEGWCGKPSEDETTPPEVDDVDVTKPECPERSEMGDTHGQGPKDCGEKPECPETDEVAAGEEMPEGCDDGEEPTVVNAGTASPGAVLGTDLGNAPVVAAALAAEETATVLGVQLERPAAAAAAAAAAPADTTVLGAALARTGMSFTVLAVALALALLAIGAFLKRSAARI